MIKDKIKKKFQMKMSRRQVLKSGLIAGAGMMLPWRYMLPKAYAGGLGSSIGTLNDPALVDKFMHLVPDALHPSFKFLPVGNGKGKAQNYRVGITKATNQFWGTKNGGSPLSSDIFGYGGTWPGKTFEVQSGRPVKVQWENNLHGVDQHLLHVDTSLHWCYSLHGYENRSIANDGIPTVTHLHGGHSQYRSDGNPEQFFSPGYKVKGPRFRGKTAVYHNDQSAGNLWYHDHALGITRLNVYAGLAGFYFVRDNIDTGKPDNPVDLPAWPYEKAYAIQDRMYKADGQLFYPGFPGDPFYDDFITGEGAILPEDVFPNGGPTALAEFFGDHMVVNGVAWPKEDVEPRNYRLHLLNGTDSRFMVVQFRLAGLDDTVIPEGAPVLPFSVVGSDQGLASSATQIVDTLILETGSRYDIVFDFDGLENKRIIMENLGGDAPFGGAFGGDLEPEDFFIDRQTDRIMAFDVVKPFGIDDPDDVHPNSFKPLTWSGPYVSNPDDAGLPVRKVALFEGMDEFGRLQPLLGVAEPTVDAAGNIVNGTIAWHSPTTENPALNSTEIWEIYNATGDAHPVHLHLVHFEILDRQEFTADVIEQDVLQHNGTTGNGFRLENIEKVAGTLEQAKPEEKAPKDMVTALPTQNEEAGYTGQVTRIKATFDKPGRYVWHCHILSHEDHEMMRVLHIGGGA